MGNQDSSIEIAPCPVTVLRKAFGEAQIERAGEDP